MNLKATLLVAALFNFAHAGAGNNNQQQQPVATVTVTAPATACTNPVVAGTSISAANFVAGGVGTAPLATVSGFTSTSTQNNVGSAPLLLGSQAITSQQQQNYVQGVVAPSIATTTGNQVFNSQQQHNFVQGAAAAPFGNQLVNTQQGFVSGFTANQATGVVNRGPQQFSSIVPVDQHFGQSEVIVPNKNIQYWGPGMNQQLVGWNQGRSFTAVGGGGRGRRMRGWRHGGRRFRNGFRNGGGRGFRHGGFRSGQHGGSRNGGGRRGGHGGRRGGH